MKTKHTTSKWIMSCYSVVFLLVFVQLSMFGQGWKKYFPQKDISNTFPLPNPSNGNTCMVSTFDGGTLFFRQEFAQGSANTEMNLIRVDKDGDMIWDKIYNQQDSTLINPSVFEIKQLSDGSFVFSGHYLTNNYYVTFLKKIDQHGNEIWERHFVTNNNGFLPFRNYFVESPDGGYLLACINNGPYFSGYLIKTNSLGNVLWEKHFDDAYDDIIKVFSNLDTTYSVLSDDRTLHRFDDQGSFLNDYYLSLNGIEVSDVVLTQDGGYLFVGYNYTQIGSSLMVVKNSSTGAFQWQKIYPQFGAILESNQARVIHGVDSGYVISANLEDTTGLDIQRSITMKIDDSGGIIWNQIFQGTIRDLVATKDSSYLLSGYADNYIQFGVGKTVHLIKLDKDGGLYDSYISGNINRDFNLNCLVDSNELGLQNYLLEVKNDQTFYTLSDASGNYKFNLDTGSYDIRALNTAQYWKSCVPTTTVQVNLNDSIIIDFPHEPIISCPYLTINVSTPFLRRCFDNEYFVSYCNQGTTASANTMVELDFHPHFSVISSTIPWSSQSGNLFTFPVGNLDISECGSFKVTANPDCDSTILEQTLCVNASISPDSICTPSAPSWDGSITDLAVSCGADSVTFTIKNIGQGDMVVPLEYFVIEDNFITKQAFFQLFSLESMQLKFPANGSTYRLYAGQAPGYFPPNYFPTIAYEGCGVNATGNYSTGFITMFPENNALNTETVYCQELIGSFDPNDKQATPKGYGNEHFIETGVDLDYKIRFQNTGTDTAFTVVIKDTISGHLDMATLLQGAASHPYSLDIMNGNVLKYTFNNILLPDSTTNEPGSHGFVKFKISQQPNLSLGTLIHNSAAIYFDFNEPVITNETYHEIGEDFIPIIVTTGLEPSLDDPEMTVLVQPNPFVHYAEFILEKAPTGNKIFELYSALGQLQRREAFTGEDNHLFYKKQLGEGVYFYKILNDNQHLTSGKLIVGGQ